MPQQTTLIYSEPLLRKAVSAFWRRTVGLNFLLGLLFTASSLAVLIWCGNRSWLVGVVGAILFLAIALALLVYFAHRHNALAKFRAMDAQTASLTIDDTSLTMTSGLGSTTLPWSAVKEIWLYPSFWLLLFSKGQFVTLPLASVPTEMRTSIIGRVSAAGGKVT